MFHFRTLLPLLAPRMRFCRASGKKILLATLLACGMPAALAAADSWPTVALPEDARSVELAGQLAMNGMPMQTRVFTSAAKPAALLDWFRRSLGQPLVENTLGAKHLLGRLQGSFYLLVQLEAEGSGSRGLVAVTRLRAEQNGRRAAEQAAARLLARLPAGTRILTQAGSVDAGKSANYLLLINDLQEALNRDRIVELLREDGYTLERETLAAAGGKIVLPAGIQSGRQLLFKGAGKQALALLFRNRAGQSSIALNTVTTLEQLP